MTDPGCSVDAEGVTCELPCVAKGLCARHYQQHQRGRLGKTKKIAKPGQAGIQIKVVVDPNTFKAIMKRAKQERKSLSEVTKALIGQG